MYPDTPFVSESFKNVIISGKVLLTPTEKDKLFNNLNKWLCQSPKFTSFRVNTLLYNPEDILQKLREESSRKYPHIAVDIHRILKDVIIIKYNEPNKSELLQYEKEIIVDHVCGAAILRGAHIFAPGVIGMTNDCRADDFCSVYADISTEKCKKGFAKKWMGSKVFLGNGIVKLARNKLFFENDESVSGIAVEMVESISGAPFLDFPKSAGLLQNLSSIVCVYNLDPQVSDTILDMCAAPGHKTSLIGSIIANKGVLVALDKTKNKLHHLQDTCSNFGVEAHCFMADSTKICDENLMHCSDVVNGPPFGPQSFDKILLDAPCSALGKRPQFINRDSLKVIKSFPPLQRKLFKTAYQLLKVGGTLVYSTCTITSAENEEIVAWALQNFPLKLEECKVILGRLPAWPVEGLSEEDLGMLQRFGPENDEIDSVGFFVAKFIKV